MTRTRTATLAAVLIGGIALPVLADFHHGFAAWDNDGDGSIGQIEFNETFTELELFEDWDTDGDGFLSEQELGVALFEGYDKDESGRIELPEFERIGQDLAQDGLLEI